MLCEIVTPSLLCSRKLVFWRSPKNIADKIFLYSMFEKKVFILLVIPPKNSASRIHTIVCVEYYTYLNEFDDAVRNGGFAESLQVLYDILCL